MAVCDKWVILKIFEFLVCVGCVVAKRIADDDAARLALRLQRLSREWSLLRSVTWDAVGGSFADAVYGGYVIITFGLLLGRLAREVPRGRRVLEGFMLGLGLILFIVLGGLVLSAIDSVRDELVAHAASLGALSLIAAALFLVDLMGPRVLTTARHTQTESPAASAPAPVAAPAAVTKPPVSDKMNGKPGGIQKETSLFSIPSNGYTKFSSESVDAPKDDLEKSKFGSFRSRAGDTEGAYVRLADPAADEGDRLHYERELARFNERFVKQFLRQSHGAKREQVKEDYLPELQTPVFAQTRARSLLDELTPSYEMKSRSAGAPTLHQLEDYLRRGSRERSPSAMAALFPMAPIAEARDSLEDRAGGSPTDPGFVQYAARRWPDRTDGRTPRHSPTK